MSEFLEFDGLTAASFAYDEQRRTMTGVVVPWGKVGRHKNGRRWRFERGALKFGDAKYIRLNSEHVQSARLGRAVSAEDTDEGLVMTFRLYDGRDGDLALALAADGVKTGFSVEIEADEADTEPDPDNPGVLLVKMAHLTGVGFVKDPAFTDARLLSMVANRNGGNVNTCPTCGVTLEDGVAHTCTPAAAPAPQPVTLSPDQFSQLVSQFGQGAAPAATPQPADPQPADPTPAAPQPVTLSPDQFSQLVTQFGHGEGPAVVDPTKAGGAPAAQSAVTQVSEPKPYQFSRVGVGKYAFSGETEFDFSTDLIELINRQTTGRDCTEQVDRLNGFIAEAFADVEIADLPGTLPSVPRPDMWVPQRDYATPLWDLTGRGAPPHGSRKFDIPKFTSSSGLVSVATEKTEPAGGSFVDELQTVTPGQLWGKVEITRQVWRQGGNPAFSGILWSQMLREFYEDREAAIATFLGTLTAATDIALTGTDASPSNDEYQATMESYEQAYADLQFARGGNRFEAFAVHQALYRVASRVKDDTGRPLYPMINPQNANGTTMRRYSTIDVAGSTWVPSYALGTPANASTNSWLFDPAVVLAWAGTPERMFWDFGATIQTANLPQLSFVTVGLYADYATANTDISGVRQVTFDPNTEA